MKRVFFIILTLVLFSACATKKSYILSNLNDIIATQTLSQSIGVKTIELPQYLLGKEIPFLQHKNEIVYLKNKKWATYLDDQLTNRIISTLQKSFNTPKVYQYPQNTSTKPDIIIQIIINKFIADENSVSLDATWSKNGTKEPQSRLFSIKVPIDSKEDIINAMNKAFNALEKELVGALNDNPL